MSTRELETVGLEAAQVTCVKGRGFEPFERPESDNLLGHRLFVTYHQVDFGVIGACPVPAYNTGSAISGLTHIRHEPAERLQEYRLNGPATPGCP